MTRPREHIVTVLTDALDDDSVDVVAYARQLETVARDTVMVKPIDITPVPESPSFRLYTFALLLVVAQQDPTGPADLALEDLLWDVMDAVDHADGLRWVRSQRATYAGVHPAYEITANVVTNQEGTT